MINKIQEITDKVYKEGIEKAKVEATRIIADAKNVADGIIKSARQEESKIVQEANKRSIEIKNNTDSEMQLAARQFISKLKQQITNVIITAQIEKPIKDAFNDVEFVKRIIQTVIQNWNPQKPEESELQILLPVKDEKHLSEFFKIQTLNTLDKTIEVSFDTKIKNGFIISPKNGSYIISFSNTDFENYFKGYLKDRTMKLLFESET